MVLRRWWRSWNNAFTIDWADVVFEVDLLKSQEINLDYILELIFEHNKKTKNKATLVDEVRRLIRASVGNRAKESLVVDFINQANLDEIPDKTSVIEAFFSFARAEQQREAVELIADENLNTEAAKRYISTSFLPTSLCVSGHRGSDRGMHAKVHHDLELAAKDRPDVAEQNERLSHC